MYVETFQTMSISLSIGNTFCTIEELKNTCTLFFAIQSQFEYSVVRSDRKRYIVKCKGENCTWRLHASIPNDSARVVIKNLASTHACTGINHLGHTQASKKVISA